MGGSHHTNPPRRKSGVSSVLRSKTLAQAEFSSAEQVQSPKGERPTGANPQKSHDLSRGFLWWTRSDSNRRPPQCECGALPTALQAHNDIFLTSLLSHHGGQMSRFSRRKSEEILPGPLARYKIKESNVWLYHCGKRGKIEGRRQM